MTAPAPITETLASALILFTPWKKDRILVDPFCGSGTFPIEAAMLAANMAPGMKRHFLAEKWENLIPICHFQDAKEEAADLVDLSVETDIQGYDIDGEIIKAARANAKMAGVDHLIHFQQRPVSELSHPKKYGFVITNPPYGERIMEKQEAEQLYRLFGEAWRKTENWKLYLLSSHTEFERTFGKTADKKRKLYNGMIKCDLFMYGRF